MTHDTRYLPTRNTGSEVDVPMKVGKDLVTQAMNDVREGREASRAFSRAAQASYAMQAYDAAKLIDSHMGRSALTDHDLLAAVREHNLIAFPTRWKRFEEAVDELRRYAGRLESDPERLTARGEQSLRGIMFAGRPETAASELARVCRKGARIALTTWHSGGMQAVNIQKPWQPKTRPLHTQSAISQLKSGL